MEGLAPRHRNECARDVSHSKYACTFSAPGDDGLLTIYVTIMSFLSYVRPFRILSSVYGAKVRIGFETELPRSNACLVNAFHIQYQVSMHSKLACEVGSSSLASYAKLEQITACFCSSK